MTGAVCVLFEQKVVEVKSVAGCWTQTPALTLLLVHRMLRNLL